MEIKPGDLVMVVKPYPCCGNSRRLGVVAKVLKNDGKLVACSSCGVISYDDDYHDLSTGFCAHKDTLKKIDPPSEGDSLPTRADLKLEA